MYLKICYFVYLVTGASEIVVVKTQKRKPKNPVSPRSRKVKKMETDAQNHASRPWLGVKKEEIISTFYKNFLEPQDKKKMTLFIHSFQIFI